MSGAHVVRYVSLVFVVVGMCIQVQAAAIERGWSLWPRLVLSALIGSLTCWGMFALGYAIQSLRR